MDNEHTGRFRRMWARRYYPAEPQKQPREWRDPDEYRDDDDFESDIDAALIERLRNMEWPKPSDEVRERCLRQIMQRIDEQNRAEEELKALEDAQGDSPEPDVEEAEAPAARSEQEGNPPHGSEERHPATRFEHPCTDRPPLRVTQRPL
jgi:hypothetical protein